ncbi:hypothetical protein IGI04_014560 [Brassica rapa subsp. trilocularis]|uniref:Uncharacterized protein n=1 Tax=Brassica rapa subsp. trilocularis TaxID=1813537 RepID=A0ABQ7MMJ9_BRACM|nr:hypothetical protein IGI04_014560 [Brassica rapa subsp. trilocularis]
MFAGENLTELKRFRVTENRSSNEQYVWKRISQEATKEIYQEDCTQIDTQLLSRKRSKNKRRKQPRNV